MQRLRESLAAGMVERIEKELGREAMLRLLWPHLVGSQLAANTELQAVQGATLVVGVPDRGWLQTLGSLQQQILEAVNRLGSGRYDSIELVEQPRMAAPRPAVRTASRRRQSAAAAEIAPIDASVIPDQGLREVFASSARKYFAAQPARLGTQPRTK